MVLDLRDAVKRGRRCQTGQHIAGPTSAGCIGPTRDARLFLEVFLRMRTNLDKRSRVDETGDFLPRLAKALESFEEQFVLSFGPAADLGARRHVTLRFLGKRGAESRERARQARGRRPGHCNGRRHWVW